MDPKPSFVSFWHTTRRRWATINALARDVLAGRMPVRGIRRQILAYRVHRARHTPAHRAAQARWTRLFTAALLRAGIVENTGKAVLFPEIDHILRDSSWTSIAEPTPPEVGTILATTRRLVAERDLTDRRIRAAFLNVRESTPITLPKLSQHELFTALAELDAMGFPTTWDGSDSPP